MIADISLLTKHNLSHWYTLTHYILQVYVLNKYLLHFRNTLIEQHRRAGQRGMESIPSGVIVMRGTLKGYEQPIFSISGPSSLQGPRLALTISPPLSPSPRGPHLHVMIGSLERSWFNASQWSGAMAWICVSGVSRTHFLLQRHQDTWYYYTLSIHSQTFVAKT